jgi:thiamine-phosphate pyrophosphorylase
VTPGGGGVPRLHVVTDDEVLARERWVSAAIFVLRAGGPSVALHVRGPRTSSATIHRLVTALLGEARRSGAWLVLNDRVDVALATGVTAVHLGRRSLPLEVARRLLGTEARIGVSCHSGDEVAGARSGGADYAFVGTIFPTPGHPGAPGIGVEGLRRIAAGAEGLPVVGIGGVDADRVEAVRAAGVHGVAAIRGVWDTEEPAVAVARYVTELTVADEKRSQG